VTETAHYVHVVLALRLPGVAAGFYLRIFAFYVQCLTVADMGVRRNFSRGVGKVDILLILFSLLGMQGTWTYSKKKMSNVTAKVAYSVFL